MPGRTVQFAVVREDAEVDLEVLRRTKARRALLVASGGCTAFEILSRADRTAVTLVDPNPAQLDLVERKLDALTALDPAARPARFNVGTDDPEGLCQCGNFEALFRQLRGFLHEFVAPPAAWSAFFAGDEAARPEAWFASPYWPVAFEIFFSDPLLETMFTPAATRHAEPGSYPAHFRGVFERGLLREDARANPFLHHALLGRYLAEHAPPYLGRPIERRRARLVQSSLEELDDFSEYDYVGLSNVMDWMERDAIDRLGERVARSLAPGAAVVWRQLNHPADLAPAFGPRIRFDDALSDALLDRDRSLFYDRVRVGFVDDPA
ncbi:MAG: DUF3419 family protein [Planctomycetota bacterium JB042]